VIIFGSYYGKFSGDIESQSSAFDVELCLTRADAEKHRYNSKCTPQLETTNYLAKKNRVQSIKIRRQTFPVLWVERSVTFKPLAPGL